MSVPQHIRITENGPTLGGIIGVAVVAVKTLRPHATAGPSNPVRSAPYAANGYSGRYSSPSSYTLPAASRLQSLQRPSYQISFNPNCTGRDVVEVLVIAPAVPKTTEE